MREIRTSGSEGGGGRTASPYPYLSFYLLRRSRQHRYGLTEDRGP